MILAKQIEFQTSFPIHTRFDFHEYQILNFSIFYHIGLKISMKYSWIRKFKECYITQNLSLAVLVIYGWAIYFEYGWKVVVAYPEEDLESFSAQQSYLRFWEILIVWF